jgi:hypothetical protein
MSTYSFVTVKIPEELKGLLQRTPITCGIGSSKEGHGMKPDFRA